MPNQKVRAAVLHGARDLRIEERDLPPPAADEVQVAVLATGLCGSDLHYFHHHRNGDIVVREPLILGHESIGAVVAVGADPRSPLVPGDRVALEVGLPCERCDLCSAGRYNICPEMRFRSSAKSSPHAQGTLRDRLNHPARWCHKLPSALSNHLAALLEPLSVAVHARDRASLPAGAKVLVLGAGAVGLLVAAVSKASGASVVVVADVQQTRLDFAVAHGFADASILIPPRPTTTNTTDEKLAHARHVAALITSTKLFGGEVSATYECTGAEACVQAAIYASGKVVLIGMGTPVMTLPVSAAALREVDIIGVFRYASGTYARAVAMLADRPAAMPDIAPLVTHRLRGGVDAVVDAFAVAGRSEDDEGKPVLKVVVEME